MLTSPRTNVTDGFIPGHHLALITQPVLGARSRSRKKANIIIETSTSSKEKLDSMTSTRRSSYNDSPPLILPINRIDTSQYQKKNNFNSHHESSDSGLDLSLSTNSSVQFQQYSQQHFQNHRPLSALNEDSSPDDGYHDENPQVPMDMIRLRCPPISLGRNRSMEDMISNNTHEEQQHRSSSFSDERQQKLSSQQERKMKRSSDGALLDLIDGSHEPTESYRRTTAMKNELFHTVNTQQHRSLNDLTNKTFSKVSRNESNMLTINNNLSTTHTVIRKPNMSTLKPSRKKTKLNVLMEPSVPLTSSRFTVYDTQMNALTGATSSSSNQTTPRSIRPLGQQQQQQQVKLKSKTQLAHYPNPEQIRAHVNRSVLERQQPTNLVAATSRGLIQQIIPFDASPSKFNNLLLRHCIQQQQQQPQVNTIYHPSSNTLSSPSRQLKQTSKTLYNEENTMNYQDEKRKQKEQMKIKKLKGYEEKKWLKHREDFENHPTNEIYDNQVKDTQESISLKNTHKREKSQDTFEQATTQRYHQIGSIQRQQEKDLLLEKSQQRNTAVKNRLVDENENVDERPHMENIFTSTPRHQYEQLVDSQSGGSFINDSNRNSIVDRHEYIQSNNATGKFQNTNFINRRQQRNVGCINDSLHMTHSNHIHRDTGVKQQNHGLKPTAICLRNKTQNHITERSLNQTTEPNSQYRSDYLHGSKQKSLVPSQSRPSKIHFPSYENPTNRYIIIETQTDPNHHRNPWKNPNNENDSYQLQKFQNGSTSKVTRMQPIFPKNANIYELRREREITQLSYMSKEDCSRHDETKFDQKYIEKNSNDSFQIRSPISWSITSEHRNDQQQYEIYEKTNVNKSVLSTSPLSNEELIDDNFTANSRNYPITPNDNKQPVEGKYSISSNNLHSPSVIGRSSHPSSCHTYPFTCTNDIENKNDTLVDNHSITSKNKKYNSNETNNYVLSEGDSQTNRIPVRNSSSHSENFSSNKKIHSPSEKLDVSIEKEEVISNYDSDDGWSDDSAELIYVDERYAAETRKITSPSHLSSQQPYHYQIQQQNVLLQ